MEKVVLNVEGMSCGHCVNAVKNAISEIEGVYEVEVSLEDKKVSFNIDNSEILIEKVKNAIEEEGYDVV